jgi:hypothetical protein
MRTSDAHKGALAPLALTRNGYEHTMETIPLDPVAVRRLDAGFRAILDRLSPTLQINVRRSVRWTPVLRTYVRYLHEHHRMTYGVIADHLNFAYGTHLFSEESLASLFSDERVRARKTVGCGPNATGSSKMRTIRHSIDK